MNTLCKESEELMNTSEYLKWQEIKCPKCNSNQVEMTAEVPIRFCISYAGHIQLNSDILELTRSLDKVMSEDYVDTYKCLKCGNEW